MGRLCKKRYRTKEYGYLLRNYKKYYRKLLLERTMEYIYLGCFVFLATCALWIISLCIDSKDVPEKLNKCLKTHSIDYCNREIK